MVEAPVPTMPARVWTALPCDSPPFPEYGEGDDSHRLELGSVLEELVQLAQRLGHSLPNLPGPAVLG